MYSRIINRLEALNSRDETLQKKIHTVTPVLEALTTSCTQWKQTHEQVSMWLETTMQPPDSWECRIKDIENLFKNNTVLDEVISKATDTEEDREWWNQFEWWTPNVVSSMTDDSIWQQLAKEAVRTYNQAKAMGCQHLQDQMESFVLEILLNRIQMQVDEQNHTRINMKNELLCTKTNIIRLEEDLIEENTKFVSLIRFHQVQAMYCHGISANCTPSIMVPPSILEIFEKNTMKIQKMCGDCDE